MGASLLCPLMLRNPKPSSPIRDGGPLCIEHSASVPPSDIAPLHRFTGDCARAIVFFVCLFVLGFGQHSIPARVGADALRAPLAPTMKPWDHLEPPPHPPRNRCTCFFRLCDSRAQQCNGRRSCVCGPRVGLAGCHPVGGGCGVISVGRMLSPSSPCAMKWTRGRSIMSGNEESFRGEPMY